MSDLNDLLERYDQLHSTNDFCAPIPNSRKYNNYAVSNFRGGIGKTTLSFNLAYELSRTHRMLFVDVCPQRNFSELLLGEDIHKGEYRNIHDAMLGKIMGAAWEDANAVENEPLSRRVRDTNQWFNDTKMSHVIPGSNELFLFPSQLYTQLNQYYSMTSGSNKSRAVGNLLKSLKDTIENEKVDLKSEITLIDSSPFFGGATHLAWMAADALIIPVRVDEQSIFALELTLKMLSDMESDFHIWRNRAEIESFPKVQAILITHCGWNRQAAHRIDSTSKMFIERAIELANRYAHLFSTDRPTDHFALLSDFQSAGKISGAMRKPIALLEAGRFFTIEGRRLEVNQSVQRYQKELKYAKSIIG